jgi:CheY-like chemotaxis protein
MAPLLIVDDEPLARAWLRRMVGAGEAREAASGAEALRALESCTGPWVVLLDWHMPEIDGAALCRIVRARFASTPHYIIMMSARAGRADVAAGLAAGADDFLLKPIAPDTLRARLRVAARHVGGGPHPSSKVLAALEEAVGAGDGELLVRGVDAVGRVLVHGGEVAWAHIANDGDSLLEVLSDDGLTRDEVRAAFEEARRTRGSVHRVLVAWGLLTAERLRSVLLAWTRRRVSAMLRFEGPQALFLPSRREGSGEFSFPLSEVLTADDVAALAPPRQPAPSPSVPPASSSDRWRRAFLTASEPRPEFERYLDAAMGVEGADSAALFHRATGLCEGWRGDTMDPSVAWAKLQAIHAMVAAGEGVEDLLASTRESYHLLRALRADPERVLYLVVRREASTLGGARAALVQIADA